MKRYIFALVGLAMVGLALLSMGRDTPTAQAAPGDLLATVTVPVASSSCCGIGIAFDGTDILYTNFLDPTIHKTDLSAANNGSLPLVGATNCCNAIAFDASTGTLWGGTWDQCDIYEVDLTTGVASLRHDDLLPCPIGFIDGLAWDPVNDTLWWSDDVNCTVTEINKTTGATLRTFNFFTLIGMPACSDGSAVSCGNSGLAVGLDHTLFMGSDGCGIIYSADASPAAPAPPVFLGSFVTVGGRDEDMECGPQFTKPDGSMVETLLSKDAFNNTFAVIEMAPEQCISPVVRADVELLEINKGQPIDAVECETPHQPANGRAMAHDPSTGRIYYTESDAFHGLDIIIEATFTPSTTCPTISECQVIGESTGKPFFGLPIPIGALAHDPGRSAAAGVPVFWAADYDFSDAFAHIFEVKYTPPVCPAFHLTSVPMPDHPCLAHFFQPPGGTDGMDYDAAHDEIWFSDDASQQVWKVHVLGADPQAGEQVDPPTQAEFEIAKCNTGIAFNPAAGEANPLWLVEYAINLPTINIEEVYLSQRSGQHPGPVCNPDPNCTEPAAGVQVFEALGYDSGLHPPDGRNSRAWEDAEFDETKDAKGDCGVLSNENATDVRVSGENRPSPLHTIIRFSVPCSGVPVETLRVSERKDIGLTAMYRNNGPLDPVDILMWKQADAPEGCDVSIHTEDNEEITIAAGVPFFEKLPDGTLVPLGVGPAAFVPGPSHTIVAQGTPGVQFELDVHLVIPNNPSTASPFGAKLAHHELFDKHCSEVGLHHYEFCVDLQPVKADNFHTNANTTDGAIPDPNPDNNRGCVAERIAVPIDVDKDYRSTNVCFEKDNDGDGKFSEDPIDFDAAGNAIDNDGDGLFNEDPVDCPGGTSLGTPLPIDASSGKFKVEAVLKKNGTVSSYNPGQYYAVSTVKVGIDLDKLWIFEFYGDCTEEPKTLSALNPLTGGGNVVIVDVGPDGVAKQIADSQSPNVDVTDANNNGVPDNAEAHLENVPEDHTILMYVKFGPGLKGKPVPPDPNNMCDNQNVATAHQANLNVTDSAGASLIVLPKP